MTNWMYIKFQVFVALFYCFLPDFALLHTVAILPLLEGDVNNPSCVYLLNISVLDLPTLCNCTVNDTLLLYFEIGIRIIGRF